MELTYEISPHLGRAVIVARGTGAFEDFLAAMHALTTDSAFSTELDILADLRDIDYTPAVRDIRLFAKRFGHLRALFGRRAVFIVKDRQQLKLGRFAALVAKAMDFELGVFEDVQRATAWLDPKEESNMMALKTKIIDKLAQPQLAALATVTQDGKPWVRYVMIRTDPDLTIRFATVRGTRKVEQIAGNPDVHLLAGVTTLAEAESWVQIQGLAEISDAAEERHNHWNEGLRAYFDGPDDPNYVVCLVRPTRIEFMQMSAMKPEVWVSQTIEKG
ncbi:MAG: pyridoxamine 5'-phosphate oxidase family protein [Myxococcota bacterium]|nr:pyridoxamine 5'-phosphate oxidase family protein [Myxococcota bacterium]